LVNVTNHVMKNFEVKEREMADGPALEDMEYVVCNLCGSDNADRLYSMPDVHFHPNERFEVVRCRTCGLGYCNPRPRQAILDKYYPAAFYEGFESQSAAHERRYAREAAYVLRYAHLRAGIRPKLLDIGCANGGFPRHMKALNWDVEGLEIGSAAQRITDFKVHNMLFSHFPVRAPTYDALTAWAVLEHVHDPMAYFKKAQEILVPGGVFVLLVTNLDSLSSSGLYREDLPRHIYFFNQKVIRAYAAKTGFELVKAINKDDIYGMLPVGWLLYKINHLLRRSPLKYEEMTLTFTKWTRSRNLPRTVGSFLKYASGHPLVVLDRVGMPLYAQWQKMTGTYGISTYVLRRNASSFAST
jgi:2-polyprenyl-3-methyl-5-hydroxy-6-metoxy-1,4-benzoquinol methylase